MINKKILGTIVLLCIISGFIGYELPRLGGRSPKVNANVFIFAETMRGDYEVPIHNVMTNIAERYVRNLLGFNNETAHNETKWISLSNDASPAVTWTELPNELDANGFTRALGTVAAWYNGTDYAYNVTKKFTATGTQQLQAAGLQWSGVKLTDNNLFACAAFSQTTFNNNDNCTITWVITIDAN